MSFCRVISSVAALTLSICAVTASAAEWPARRLHIIVASTAGGGTDLVTRMVGAKLTDALKQPVVVESKPGGNGAIADDYVANAPADGYVFLFQSQSITVNSSISKVSYDPLVHFQPVAKLISQAFVIVATPKLPVKTLRDVVAYSMTRPKGLNAAVPGSATYLTGELFKLTTNARLEFVPYKGGAPAALSIIGGETDIAFMDVPSIAAHITGGRVNALAVTTEKRVKLIPDVPTAAEAGMPELKVEGWLGSFAPANTPADIVNRLNAEINTALRAPDVAEKIVQIGGEPAQTTVAEFTKFYRAEIARWKDVVTQAKIKRE